MATNLTRGVGRRGFLASAIGAAGAIALPVRAESLDVKPGVVDRSIADSVNCFVVETPNRHEQTKTDLPSHVHGVYLSPDEASEKQREVESYRNGNALMQGERVSIVRQHEARFFGLNFRAVYLNGWNHGFANRASNHDELDWEPSHALAIPPFIDDGDLATTGYQSREAALAAAADHNRAMLDAAETTDDITMWVIVTESSEPIAAPGWDIDLTKGGGSGLGTEDCTTVRAVRIVVPTADEVARLGGELVEWVSVE